MKNVFGILLLISILTAGITYSPIVEAHGRRGSHRVGGTNSHGKGSHYVGGRK